MALKELQKVPGQYTSSPWRSNADFVMGQTYDSQTDNLNAARAYQKAAEIKIGELSPLADARARQIVLNDLKKEELSAVLAQEDGGGSLAEDCTYRLIQLADQEKNFDQASNLAHRFFVQWPTSEFTSEVQKVLDETQGKVTGDRE